MKTNNLKFFTNAYFSLFLILSYDLAANSLSRKKNWIVFAVENIKNIDFGDFFRKHEKKSKCADFEKFQHFRWIWHFFRFFTLRGTCGCSLFFSYAHSSELHSDFRNLVFTHFPKFQKKNHEKKLRGNIFLGTKHFPHFYKKKEKVLWKFLNFWPP